MQADDQDMQHDGLSGKGTGKSRKGQGRWLSRWLVRDGSSRKQQAKERAGGKKPEAGAPQQSLETKSLDLRKAPAADPGPGKQCSCICVMLHALQCMAAVPPGAAYGV